MILLSPLLGRSGALSKKTRICVGHLPTRLCSVIKGMLIWIAWVGIASAVLAEDAYDDRTSNALMNQSGDANSELTKQQNLSVEPGMSLDAIKLQFGREPDRADTVGACGIMQTSDWISEGVRVLSTGTQVISIVPLDAESSTTESIQPE